MKRLLFLLLMIIVNMTIYSQRGNIHFSGDTAIIETSSLRMNGFEIREYYTGTTLDSVTIRNHITNTRLGRLYLNGGGTLEPDDDDTPEEPADSVSFIPFGTLFDNDLYTHNNAINGEYVGYFEYAKRDTINNKTFSFITGNDNDIFAIDTNGLITVAEPDSIDYATKGTYNLTVGLVFGTKADTADLTINVYNPDNVIYIDFSSGSGGSGTFASPLNSLTGVTTADNKIYLCKRNTVETTSSSFECGNDNVTVDAYGVGSLPKMTSSAANGSKLINAGGSSDIIIRHLEVESTNNATTVVHWFNSDGGTIDRCKFHGSEWGIRANDDVLHTGKITIQHTEVYETGDDGLFLANVDSLHMFNNYVYDINQKWFTDQSDGYSGGDCVQQGTNSWYKHEYNIYDHSSTGNKFALIDFSPNASGCKLENNVFIGPYLSDGGGCVYLTSVDSLELYGNVIKGSIHGIYGPGATNMTAAYNVIKNIESGYGILVANGLKAYNNVVDNVKYGMYTVNGNITSYNNIFINNNLGGYIYQGSTTRDYNLYYNNGDLVTPTGNELSSDPLFLQGYKIPTGSPAKDAGTSVGYSNDFFGNPVPFNGTVDIGIHEYNE